MVHLYLVTIKNNSIKYTERSDLMTSLFKTHNKLDYAEWHDHARFELDSRKRWHLHTLVLCTRVPYFKRL